MERTLILFKPDCIERRLLGRLIARFEDKGLNLIALKMMQVTPELARRHYAEHVQKAFYSGLENFVTAAPLVAAVIEGPEAIQVVRAMVGPTNGRNAPAGTIRGDFSTSRQMNLIHASDSPESARREMEIFFTADEIHSRPTTLDRWLRVADET